ncbi:hypothetical protein AB4Z25_24885 [Rhizobium sp. RAF36]|uniref:hypothetical protein n=1 Tax=Rhizobium sp. RAF36 TaxID=3233055 RepID=UPI003F96C19F
MSVNGRRAVEEVVWIGFDGELLAGVDDRFTRLYTYTDEMTGERRVSDLTVGDEGVSDMELSRVVALGFATAEYRVMLKQEEKSGSPIKSEAELNRHFQLEQGADTTKRQARETLVDRIHVTSWVDDKGNPLPTVIDRFNSRYAWVDEKSGAIFFDYGLAAYGIYGMPLRDVVTLGFNAQEYRVMIEHEGNNIEPIQSEEELQALMPPNSRAYP